MVGYETMGLKDRVLIFLTGAESMNSELLELINALPSYVFLLDEDFHIIAVNNNFCILFQSNNANIRLATFVEVSQLLLLSDEKQVTEKNLNQIKKGGGHLKFIAEVPDKNFNKKIIEFTASYLTSRECFIFAGIDKTSDPTLDNIISTVPGSIYWKDQNGVYQGCNDFMVKKAGLQSCADIVGKTDYELWPSWADDIRKNDLDVIAAGVSIEI